MIRLLQNQLLRGVTKMQNNEKLRTPKQLRSKETKNKIIKASIKLFSEKGYNNTSSNEIAAESGVSIGSFYAYFKDKKQLFLEVCEDYFNQIKETILSNINNDADTLEAFIYSSINVLIEAHKYKLNFHKEVMAMELSDADIKNFVHSQWQFKFKLFKDCISSYENEILAKHTDVSLFLIYTSIENAVHLIVFSHIEIDADKLIRELAKMILKYLSYED